MDYNKQALQMHEQYRGKLEVVCKAPLETRDDLSVAYTPGVAEPCRAIAKNKEDVYRYTTKGHMVAVVTDGTAVLGLGDIGPEAALPVMEGKAALFKKFGGVDAVPICLDTKSSAPCSAWRPRSAESIWRTSPPRVALKLNSGWKRCWIFPCFMMTSTAPASS